MKQKRVWRYYCDHCKKSGCQKHAIAKHESSCIRNDSRVCRMCVFMDREQKPMDVLVAAALEGGLAGLRLEADDCPVCILSAIVRARPIPGPDDVWDDRFDDFEFKKEMNEIFQNANDARREGY